jgi:hypothetical protein
MYNNVRLYKTVYNNVRLYTTMYYNVVLLLLELHVCLFYKEPTLSAMDIHLIANSLIHTD